MATSVPPCVPVSMLVSAKLSGYLLSLLLAPVLFFAGSESLSQSQILLLLRADAQMATRQHTQDVCSHFAMTTCFFFFIIIIFVNNEKWGRHGGAVVCAAASQQQCSIPGL